jgi:hypothetical protein
MGFYFKDKPRHFSELNAENVLGFFILGSIKTMKKNRRQIMGEQKRR